MDLLHAHLSECGGVPARRRIAEITVIDAESQTVVERKALHNVAGVFHVAVSSDGKLGVATQLRPKNLIPLAHVEHGGSSATRSPCLVKTLADLFRFRSTSSIVTTPAVGHRDHAG